MAEPVRAIAVSLVYLLALFGSYCHMAPAAAGAARGWEAGSGSKYKLITTVLFRETGSSKFVGDVGFQLTGELDLTAIWKDPLDQGHVLLKMQIISPQLWIKSRKAPEPEGFVEHSSRIDDVAKKPALIIWRNGEVKNVYLDLSETVSSSNLKRGLISLFQYKTLDEDVQEVDSSGLCNVTYTSLGPKTMSKQKLSCKHQNLPIRKEHPNPLFAVKVVSSRNSTYDLTQALLPKTIYEEEKHEMFLLARPEIGTMVTSQRSLEVIRDSLSEKIINAKSVKHAIAVSYPEFQQTNLELQIEPVVCPDNGCPVLEQAVEESRDALEDSALGTAKSALAFLKLQPLVKDATHDELAKLLKSPRYRQLRAQLLDIYGSVSTSRTHAAAMRNLRQDDIGDDTERYLWALSLSPYPNSDIAKDILKRSEETMQNEKVSETMMSTAAAMARHHGSPFLIEKARVSLELGMESCTGEACKLKFLRALRNLRSKAAVPLLLSHAIDRNRAISVAAWRALTALPQNYITEDVKAAAKKVFYQLGGPRRDSTCRTLALNVILETNPSTEELQSLLEYLSRGDRAYETRKYLSQRLDQLSQKDPQFSKRLKDALKLVHKKVNNYNVLAQKGLSTAFTRNFLKSEHSKGDLMTVQEINSGLLKRGTVDVIFQTNDHEQAMFSLGLFAGGLSSFVSSNNEDPASDEPSTAGMELDILGVGIRPFVFFSGQGELMGHVWSGTASERTPAFQALTNLHSFNEFMPLASGIIAELDVQGALSLDLAGQIQLSLWSRNAKSLVEMSAGIAIQGGTKVRTNFVQSMAEFSLTMEPKLELATDVNFAGNVALCMRLTQPSTTIRHQIYKVERIPGSRHRLRKTRRVRVFSPAKSYLLNRKNNEMCSKVFS